MSTVNARPLRAASHLVLLAIVAVTLGIVGGPPLHTHSAGTTGFYNGECPLALLAAFHATSPLPAAPASAWIALAADLVALLSGDEAPSSPLRSAGSRAPPAPLG
jgi:hypothetical protein